MYMRAKQAELDRPDPEEYGAFDGVGGTEHAKELFAAVEATGWADQRGCEACPAGHLCTKSGT
ncbi:hypothetical protein ACH4FX_41920 [Streptomyces sp. NPDC018019]|uniref:hypothetical protein n=1 Tax=Streptomyces sp. NPDC018019 TaxID=3365030 RepID=UPI0037A79477